MLRDFFWPRYLNFNSTIWVRLGRMVHYGAVSVALLFTVMGALVREELLGLIPLAVLLLLIGRAFRYLLSDE